MVLKGPGQRLGPWFLLAFWRPPPRNPLGCLPTLGTFLGKEIDLESVSRKMHSLTQPRVQISSPSHTGAHRAGGYMSGLSFSEKHPVIPVFLYPLLFL